MNLVSRKSWGARAPRSSSRLASAKGVKVHYVGDTVDPRLASEHSRCVELVRGIQHSHMDSRGWSDIAYSALVCPHGDVFVGRGPNILCAANGAGLNTGHYAVCGLVGDDGLTVPSDAMLSGIRDAIEWLRKDGAAGNEIKGHKDGYSTSCPGTHLYAWVKAGAPRPDDWMETAVRKLPTLAKGATGEDVQTLRGLLLARSHPEVKTVEGSFDGTVEKAVKAMQVWGGVADDGICGPITWSILLRAK